MTQFLALLFYFIFYFYDKTLSNFIIMKKEPKHARAGAQRQQIPTLSLKISLQFSIISTTAPSWRPRTAQRWCCRWLRFWRLWKIRREAATSQRWSTSTSTCLSLWCCAHGRGPSSVCCSCWEPCGSDTLSTSSRGGTCSPSRQQSGFAAWKVHTTMWKREALAQNRIRALSV